jgi:hypothetical protein
MIAGVLFNSDVALFRESGAGGALMEDSAPADGLAKGTHPNVVTTAKPKNNLTR